MKRSLRGSVTALFGIATISGLTFIHAHASAQSIPWNPPCVDTKFVNETNCNVNLTITTNLGNVGPVSVAAGTSTIIMLPPGTNISGAISQAGTAMGVTIPGPMLPSGNQAAGVIRGIILGPAPGCCFDIYFEQPPGENGCYIWIVPGTPPCTP